MKVALVIEKFSPAGGAERACSDLARGLQARGHEVHVFARTFHHPDLAVQEHRVPVGGLFRHSSFAAQSRRTIEKERFDIIHSFTRTSFQDVLRLGGGIHREYLARTDPEYPWWGRLWRKIRPKERLELALEAESLALAATRRVVANSQRVREEAIRHYGLPAERITVIYNGVDGRTFRPDPAARAAVRAELGLREEDYALLFVGTGFRRKGLRYAVAAVDRAPAARLLVAGEGTPVPHPRAAYLGRRPDAPRLYAAADALILPTLYDPFPNACLEAMASGIPVIISRIAGVSEILDGDSIVVEEPRDVEALAEAVRRLADPSARRPMGEAARRKALQFQVDRTVEENLRVYEEVRSRKDPR